MEHGFPKRPVILENQVPRQFRPHAADRPFSMAGLTVVCIQSRAARGNAGQRLFVRRLRPAGGVVITQLLLDGRQVIRCPG